MQFIFMGCNGASLQEDCQHKTSLTLCFYSNAFLYKELLICHVSSMKFGIKLFLKSAGSLPLMGTLYVDSLSIP